jgi:hypothetical protein
MRGFANYSVPREKRKMIKFFYSFHENIAALIVYIFLAICKMGSKFVTLRSKITFLVAKVGSRNYFFEQQIF